MTDRPTQATRTIVVANRTGLHARPSVAVAQTARRFQSRVQIGNGAEMVDATDVLQVLTLGATQGTELHMTATGPDAEAALDALAELFASKFKQYLE